MVMGLLLTITFYLSILIGLCLVVLGIKKRNTVLILIATVISLFSTFLSLWSVWKLVVLLPISCVLVFSGIKYNYNLKQWFLAVIAGGGVLTILLLIG